MARTIHQICVFSIGKSLDAELSLTAGYGKISHLEGFPCLENPSNGRVANDWSMFQLLTLTRTTGRNMESSVSIRVVLGRPHTDDQARIRR